MKRFVLALVLVLLPHAEPQTAEEAVTPSLVQSRLKRAPLSGEARLEISSAIGARNYARAERLLLHEIDLRRSPDLLILISGIFFLNGEYLNSAIAMKKAEAIQPLAPADRFSLAMAYVVIHRADWARPELETLSQAEPDNPAYLYWQARLDYDDRQYTAAVDKLRKVVTLAPSSVRAYDNLGLSLEGLGRLDEAVAAYSRAVQLNREGLTKSVWPALNLGTLLSKMGRTDEAGTYLREAAKQDPKSADAAYRLGILLEKQNQTEAAMAELRRSISLKPSYAEPHYALGRLYQRIGKEKEAREAFDKFQSLKLGATR